MRGVPEGAIEGYLRGRARRRSARAETLFRERYSVGRHTYGTPTVRDRGYGTTLTVGSFCSIAADVQIFLGGNHSVAWVTTYPFHNLWPSASGYESHAPTKGDIAIGNDVWVGSGTLILSGVTVQNGAVIGARSAVTKGVGPYEIVAGNPARHVRYRFDEATIATPQQIAWWQWDDEDIVEAMPWLLSADVGAFVARYGSMPHPDGSEAERA